MKVKRDGAKLEVWIEGQLGETSPFFDYPVKDLKEIVLDLTEMTFMNSIGVKHWILWNNKIPSTCSVKLVNCPMMMASQASTVMGFMRKNMTIESLRLPYACEECGTEKLHMAFRGKDYEYAQDGGEPKINLPLELPCPKCGSGKGKLEPDFLVEKTLHFLKM